MEDHIILQMIGTLLKFPILVHVTEKKESKKLFKKLPAPLKSTRQSISNLLSICNRKIGQSFDDDK